MRKECDKAQQVFDGNAFYLPSLVSFAYRFFSAFGFAAFSTTAKTAWIYTVWLHDGMISSKNRSIYLNNSDLTPWNFPLTHETDRVFISGQCWRIGVKQAPLGAWSGHAPLKILKIIRDKKIKWYSNKRTAGGRYVATDESILIYWTIHQLIIWPTGRYTSSLSV